MFYQLVKKTFPWGDRVDFSFDLLNVHFKPENMTFLAGILKPVNLSKCTGNVCAGEGAREAFSPHFLK